MPSLVPLRRSAFTLVEMLVIMAIIGVLAALLMAGLTAAGRASRRTRCVSNLKGIGQALAAYTADFNGFVMRFSDDDDAANNTHYKGQWYTVLLKSMTNDPGGRYISFPSADKPDVPRTSDVFRCPEDKDYLFGRDRLSYGLNTDVRKANNGGFHTHSTPASNDDDRRSDFYNMSQLNNASNFILIAETGRIQAEPATNRNYRAWISNARNGDYPSTAYRPVSGMHAGQANILWGDFSVRQRGASPETSGSVNLIDAETFRLWSVRNE